MSRTQLQLEGPSLEELLDRVQDEHGPSARIVKAEKVRRGGLGGFFARESFQIEVEVPAAEPQPARSLLDLVEERNADEQRRSAPVAGATSGLSTEGDAFAAVLQRLQHETGADPLPLPDPFARLADDGLQAVRSRRRDADAFAPLAGTAAAVPAPRTAEAVPAAAPTPAAVTARPKAPARPAAKAPAKPAAKAPGKTPAKAGAKAHAKPATKPATKAPARARRATAPRTRPAAPAALVPGGARLDPAAMMAWLRALPAAPAPELGKGAVLAVCGPEQESFATAQRLALSLGLDATAAVRADATTVARRSAAWRRSTRPTVVAVGVPTAGRGRAAGEQLLKAVAPTYVVGVVAASTDTTDLRRWTDRLGGVDALAVHGLDATEDPWRLLTAGIPVAMVDELPASPAVWAGLMLDRLVAA